MKKICAFIVSAFILMFVSAGYAASTGEEESIDSSSAMGMQGDKSGMMGGVHGGGMMHQRMMDHHMMKSNVSPVTIMIQPGMMPMMGRHSMMQQGEKMGHENGGMQKEKMQQRQKMMKEHMERMERRLENIETLLSELVELQKNE
jgi:hypothetical protein